MGIISCTPKKKLVCCHLSATVIFLIGMASYAAYKFIGDGDNVPVMDDGCRTFAGLKGPEDITPYTESLAFIGSDDRENWLIHENIEQTGVEQGKISLLRGLDKSIDGEHSIDLVQDLLKDAGFPEGVDFHPHGMALTPDWVNKDDKKLFVINHAWNNGGERIEVFKVNKDAAEDDIDVDAPGVLEWEYAMGDLDGQALKDSKWQKENYGRFNGLAVCGENEVLLGKWIGPYILPGQEGYSADQFKVIDGKASVTWAGAVLNDDTDKWETDFKTVADGFTLSKSIAFNNDGSEVFVSDTIN